MRILSVVGARPNFMKIAPFCKAIDKYNSKNPSINIDHILVHTGQHYDIRMSEAFFSALNIPNPDVNLEVGSGSHAEQLAYTMLAFEKVLIQYMPDWVVVVGDVNATLACTVIAKRLNIKVCHIEAGLRSGDTTMPEEVNRLVTDRLSDLLLTPDLISSNNLFIEGVLQNKVKFVGNVMIDTLVSHKDVASKLSIKNIITQNIVADSSIPEIIPKDKEFTLITLHRPSNVDDKLIFTALINFLLDEITQNNMLIWPIHPRTTKQLKNCNLWETVLNHPSLILLEPIGYHEMLRLNMSAKIILTDSGGLQEECCVLGTPCLTLRWNTERPITLRENGGASVLVGNNINLIREEYKHTLLSTTKPISPELWDGKTAERILNAIINA